MVVRKDIGLEAIGTMAELPPDHSPLQIGARGVYQDKRFKLLGRLRVRWEDGAWDEWYADFGGDQHGWVAETQGFFMISEAAPVEPGVAAGIRQLAAGQTAVLGGKEYTVSDIKQATAAGGEGELPFVAVPGDTWLGTDLAGPGRLFAGLEWHGAEALLFKGVSALPEEIQWEGLKPVPGWKGEPVPIERKNTEAVTCPNCGGVVQQRLAGVTITLACSHCGSLIDVHQPRAAIGQKVIKAAGLVPAPLPLGKRGTLRGIEWEVLGCLWRKDPWVEWREILLYNPWHGFAWLTESAFHWNLVIRLPEVPAHTYSGPSVQGRSYRFFGSAEAEVIQVTGEFYWRVRVGEKATVADYIAPPYILSSEAYPELHEVTWSAGEYIASAEVGQAFGVTLNKGADGYFNQPNPFAEHRRSLVRLGLKALAAAVVLELVFSTFSSRKDVLKEEIAVQQPGVESAPAVTKSFEMRSHLPAHVGLHADIPSSSASATAQLVNEGTGKVYPISLPFINGTGDRSRDIVTDLPAVPAGKYHFALLPLPSGTLPTNPVHVTIQQGGLFTSNFVICLIALGFGPAWAMYRYHRFEAARWAQSDGS
jgi:hypothetical protein